MKIYAWWAGLTLKKDVFILQIISCVTLTHLTAITNENIYIL